MSRRFAQREGFFPLAAEYSPAAASELPQVREPVGLRREWTERHLQCVWYDAALRPATLQTNEGEAVEVEDPGRWNLEAGPDFLDARVKIQGRWLSGDVEVHVSPHDWIQHGHRADPRYARVRIHVTYFPGVVPADQFAQPVAQISLRKSLAAHPTFSFEAIDVTAYPWAARGNPPPCRQILERWSLTDKLRLLESAGHERLRRKTERWLSSISEKGLEQTLYEEVLTALGFKHNKMPCRRLAEILPLETLRDVAGGDAHRAYALLLGAAGLLPEPRSDWDRPTREFVRSLWDHWWRWRDSWNGTPLDKSVWRRAGVRPANRPERRLMAAALLFSGPRSLGEIWSEVARRHVDDADRRIIEALENLRDSYWINRLAWGGPRRTAALVGPLLARAIINNVFVPFAAAAGHRELFERGLLARLPVEAENLIIREAIVSLWGPDYPPAVLRSGIRQQGLLQIFHDYCLNDRSRCQSCPWPAWLQRQAPSR